MPDSELEEEFYFSCKNWFSIFDCIGILVLMPENTWNIMTWSEKIEEGFVNLMWTLHTGKVNF